MQKNENTNPIAEVGSADSGWIIDADEAVHLRGRYKFFCPDYDCKDQDRVLFVKKSSQQNNFFSHRPGFGHDIRPETLLHKLAVRWFKDKKEFEVPETVSNGIRIPKQIFFLNPDKTILEYSRLKRIKPDVKLETTSGFEFAIEIVVTSDVSDSKSKLIAEFGLPTLRVTLTSFYRKYETECKTQKVFIETFLPSLLSDLRNKFWVIPPTREESSSLIVEEIIQEEIPSRQEQINVPKTSQKTEPVGCIVIMPFIGIIWLIKWLLS